VKIFAVIENPPSTGRIRRGRFLTAMKTRGFLNLPGVPAGWVADHQYSTVDEARNAIADASTVSGVTIHRAYVIEYGNFAMLP